jgi:hypothetical protein
VGGGREGGRERETLYYRDVEALSATGGKTVQGGDDCPRWVLEGEGWFMGRLAQLGFVVSLDFCPQ